MRIPGTTITVKVGSLIGIILGPLLIFGLLYYFVQLFWYEPEVTFQDVEPDGTVVAGTPPAQFGERLKELLALGSSASYAVLYDEDDDYSRGKDEYVLRIQDGGRWREDTVGRMDDLFGHRTLSNDDHCGWTLRRDNVVDVTCRNIVHYTVADLLAEVTNDAEFFKFEMLSAIAGHSVECYRKVLLKDSDIRICLNAEGLPLLTEREARGFHTVVRAVELREVPTDDWFQPTVDHPVPVTEPLDFPGLALEDVRLPDIDVINERLEP